MARKVEKQVQRRLLGGFLCLCFALQPLVYPLHIALAHHSHDGAPRETTESSSSHSHSGHHHHHDEDGHHHHPHHDNEPSGEQAPADNPEGAPLGEDHHQHSDDDHAKFLPGQATPTGSVNLVFFDQLASPLQAAEPAGLCSTQTPRDSPVPRLHPKRVSSPRAPPTFI